MSRATSGWFPRARAQWLIGIVTVFAVTVAGTLAPAAYADFEEEWTPPNTPYHLGYSPTITLQPEDQTVDLGHEASGVATFTAAATGQPAPTVQWQSRPAGSISWQDWSDIAGETAPTLEIDVSLEDHGRQYRAVFRNHVTIQTVTIEIGAIASEPATLTVVAADPTQSNQDVSTQITAGGLSIRVDNSSVVLPSPQLDGEALVATGSMNNVTVIDLRAANPGWNVNGQVSAFTSASSSFSAAHLGWTPELVWKTASQNVTPGAAVLPGSGLAASAELASASAGAGRGTAIVGAALVLSVPTTTAPGEYLATLTITVI